MGRLKLDPAHKPDGGRHPSAGRGAASHTAGLSGSYENPRAPREVLQGMWIPVPLTSEVFQTGVRFRSVGFDHESASRFEQTASHETQALDEAAGPVPDEQRQGGFKGQLRLQPRSVLEGHIRRV